MAKYRGLLLSLRATEAHYDALVTLLSDEGDQNVLGGRGAPSPQNIAAENDVGAHGHGSALHRLPDPEDLLPPSIQRLAGEESLRSNDYLASLASRLVARVLDTLDAEVVLWLTRDQDELVVSMPRDFAGYRIPGHL